MVNGDRRRLVKVYEMKLKRETGVIRRKTFEFNEPTELFVDVAGEIVKIGPYEFENIWPRLKGLDCPNCGTPSLKSNVEDVSGCPKCGSKSIQRGVIFNDNFPNAR